MTAKRNRRAPPGAREDPPCSLFLLPGAVFFAAIFVYPSLKTIQHGVPSDVSADNITSRATGRSSVSPIFDRVLHLPVTAQTIKNTIVFLIGSIVPQVIIGLLLAVGLRRSTRVRRIGRALVLLPWLLPSVPAVSVVLFIFTTNGGLANWPVLLLAPPHRHSRALVRTRPEPPCW